MVKLEHSDGIGFTKVICKICGHKVESFALPFPRPERITLRCSECGSRESIVAWYGDEIKFIFTVI